MNFVIKVISKNLIILSIILIEIIFSGIQILRLAKLIDKANKNIDNDIDIIKVKKDLRFFIGITLLFLFIGSSFIIVPLFNGYIRRWEGHIKSKKYERYYVHVRSTGHYVVTYKINLNGKNINVDKDLWNFVEKNDSIYKAQFSDKIKLYRKGRLIKTFLFNNY